MQLVTLKPLKPNNSISLSLAHSGSIAFVHRKTKNGARLSFPLSARERDDQKQVARFLIITFPVSKVYSMAK